MSLYGMVHDTVRVVHPPQATRHQCSGLAFDATEEVIPEPADAGGCCYVSLCRCTVANTLPVCPRPLRRQAAAWQAAHAHYG